jgi:hypothetical protein
MAQPSRKPIRPPGPGEPRPDSERPFPAGELADIAVNVIEGRTAVTRPWEHCVAVSQAYAIAARQPDSRRGPLPQQRCRKTGCGASSRSPPS